VAQKGLFIGNSHSKGGIPSTISDTGQRIEIEGEEYYLCSEAYSSSEKLSFTKKTNKEVLEKIYTKYGCKLNQDIMNAGDYIVCKLVVKDKKKHTRKGTVKEIVNKMQSEKNCKVEYKKGGVVNIGIFADGGNISKNTGNDFLRIPNFQRKKLIPNVKKNLELEPYNKDFGLATKLIIGDDTIRPIMTGNNFDKKHIVGTDAHKLYHIAHKSKYDGTYLPIQTLEKDYSKSGISASVNFQKYVEKYGKIVGNYPNWKAIVPQTNLYKISIDTQKLFYFAQVISKAKVIFGQENLSASQKVEYEKKIIPSLKKVYGNIVNKYSSPIICKYTAADNDIQYIKFNGRNILQILKFSFYMGNKFTDNLKECQLFIQTNTKGVLFQFKGKPNIENSNYILMMPLTSYGDGDAEELGYSLRYDLDTNEIISNGKNYPIDESIGYNPRYKEKPKKISEKPKKSVNSLDTSLIKEQIEGLNIALKYAEKKDEKLIKDKIEGFKILLKL